KQSEPRAADSRIVDCQLDLRNGTVSRNLRESQLRRNAFANVLGTPGLIGCSLRRKLMSITRCLTVQLASLALSLTFTVGPVFARSAHVVVPADKVQWGPAPPAL